MNIENVLKTLHSFEADRHLINTTEPDPKWSEARDMWSMEALSLGWM